MAIQRDETVDIIKGMLIVLVVMGHCSAIVNYYILWFNMPCFFIVSGFFLPKLTSLDKVWLYLISKVKRLLVPYLSYLILLSVIGFVFGFLTFDKENMLRLLYGGRLLLSFLGPLWFFTVLFFSLVIMEFLFSIVKSSVGILIILILFYILSHMESTLIHVYHKCLFFPLNIDVCLLAVIYVWIGSQLYSVLSRLSFLYTLGLFVITMLLLCLTIGFNNYYFNMRDVQYTYFFYDLIVPVLFLLCLYEISTIFIRIEKVKTSLSYIGENSITIFAIHMLVINVCWKLFPTASYIGFTKICLYVLTVLVSISIPLIMNYLLKNTKVTRFFFLGQS